MSAAPPRAPHARRYLRATAGRHTDWRWACVWITQLVYFGLPWLNWNGRQMLRVDLGAQQWYCFGLVLAPPDLIYLAGALIGAALALFLGAALAGRPWCGFACPHTVYTELFLWIERKIEGGPGARARRDQAALSGSRLARKALKHGAWIALAGWIGFTLVGYFSPIRLLAPRLAAGALGAWELFWMLLYGALAYGNAGWMREQFCRYICPYARFQGVMLDRDTLLIRYDAARGEPRAPRNRKRAGQAPQGDCVDCTICVQVCPAGIDIRRGLQYECIGCAACIDACDLVMDKLGAPRGLIGYAAEAGAGWRRMARPRVLVYAGALAALAGALAAGLMLRAPLRLDVIHDRAVLLRAGADGAVENSYRLHLSNTDERAHRYRIVLSGIAGMAAAPAEVRLAAGESRLLPLTVRAAPGAAAPGSTRIRFELREQGGSAAGAAQAAVFLAPGGRDGLGGN
jgi:cytochrome c oxidase accessory protein FixG